MNQLNKYFLIGQSKTNPNTTNNITNTIYKQIQSI